MSRKRRKQRDDRKEIERQIEAVPVDAEEGDDAVAANDLIAHARVTEPELHHPVVVLASAKRRFFARPGEMHVEIALYVVDGSGARLARASSLSGPSEKAPAQLPLQKSGPDRGPEKTRYTRPGSFVLVAVMAEGEPCPSLDDPARVTVDGKGVVDIVRSRACETPRAISLAVGGEPFAPVLGGAGVVVVAAHHRVTVDLVVPVASEKLSGDVRVSLRV